MKKTLYVVNRFGTLMFNVGHGTFIGGVRPIDIDGLKYIRWSIWQDSVEKNIEVIESQLVFTNVRNTEKG